MNFFDIESRKLLTDIDIRAEAVSTIFDRAIMSADQATLDAIVQTYPKGFLDLALGGSPDYLNDEDLEGDI